jgi:16S rRNA (guanine527-N7)-methyltransferase
MSEKKAIDQINDYVPNLFGKLEPEFNWDLIDKYLDFLKRENERGGFFSKKDALVIFERHILDCLIFVWKLKTEGIVSRETKIADVGTGPGLPGFLFACLLAPPKITLIDSQRRKLALLEEEVTNGNLSEMDGKISFMYERAEDVKNRYDVITSRAVIPYPFLAEVFTNMVKKGGILCPFLGQLNFDEKIESSVLKYSGFKIKKELELTELSFLGKRHIKILQKDSDPKSGYPRPWKEIVKETKQSNG